MKTSIVLLIVFFALTAAAQDSVGIHDHDNQCICQDHKKQWCALEQPLICSLEENEPVALRLCRGCRVV